MVTGWKSGDVLYSIPFTVYVKTVIDPIEQYNVYMLKLKIYFTLFF